MDFFRASQAMRWYSLLDLSVIWDCSSRKRAGGMYVPPERMVSNFSYSAFAAACFSSAVIGFLEVVSGSRGRNLSRSCLSRSSISRFAGGPLCVCRSSSSVGAGLLLLGEGDLEGGDRFLALDGPGEYSSPGGGVGKRTADESSMVSAIA